LIFLGKNERTGRDSNPQFSPAFGGEPLIFLGFRKQGAWADWKNDANLLQIVVDLIMGSGFDHCRNNEMRDRHLEETQPKQTTSK
jgi:hypothetical protein